MGSSKRDAFPELSDYSLEPSPRPDVLGCLAILIAATSFSSVRSTTWKPVRVLGCSRTHTLVNSSIKEQYERVVEPNCSIYLRRWAPSCACPMSVGSPLEVGMSEMPYRLSRVFPAYSTRSAVWSLESEESVLPEEPVMSTSLERYTFSESLDRSLIFSK